MTQPTTKQYWFRDGIFDEIKINASALRVIELERELQYWKNKDRGHKAFQTKLIRQLKNN